MEKKAYMRPTLIAEKFDAQVFFAACGVTTEHEFVLDPSLAIPASARVLMDAGNDKLYEEGIDIDVRNTNSFSGGKAVKFIGYAWNIDKTKENELTQEYLNGCPYYAIVEIPGNASGHGFAVEEKIWESKNMS